LYDFSGWRIELVGSISPPVSFRRKFVTFDVVDMHYPYNTILSRGLLNTFEVALHSAYLCLKVQASWGVISMHDSKKDARIIEQYFALGHKNVNCLQEAEGGGQQDPRTPKANVAIGNKAAIKLKCETKRVPLSPRVPDKIVMISQDLTSEEQTELLLFLDNNNDVFAWKTSDLMGMNKSIIEHMLHVNPFAKP
jgi:hypothetical protein